MRNKLLKEGYILIAGGRDLTRIQREYKLAAFKMKTKVPGDYTPGRNDDKEDGFEPGSELINGHGDIFKCIDSTVGKASWIQIGNISDLTADSHLNDVLKEAQQQIKAIETNGSESKAEVAKSDGSEESGEDNTKEDKEKSEASGDADPVKQESPDKTSKEKSNKKKPASNSPDILETDSGPMKGKTPLPESAPYYKYLTEKNGIETVEKLTRIAKDNGLKDLKYMNESRAQDVKSWLFDEED